ncbi:MAG: helix-turn-helix transcriptional regulator [Roseiarcus sp.]|jgi:predicted transcriptional regulator
MKPQTITTPAGDELVVLPRAEYDALLAVAAARLPPEVSAAMLRGDSLLKALRKWRDETQLHLAFKTNIAQGSLSDMESGRRKGTDETLEAIAKALDVPAEWLLD